MTTRRNDDSWPVLWAWIRADKQRTRRFWAWIRADKQRTRRFWLLAGVTALGVGLKLAVLIAALTLMVRSA